MEQIADITGKLPGSGPFHHVESSARIAVYDDLLSSPRIIEVQPNTTREYINEIASAVYSSAKEGGGSIPYSIILQVAENFIHSYFTEVVVSVMDGGNTIRFADQGPGISDKEKAKTPGFSSATADMKRIINGVGSGLPIVSEYMETMNGCIEIEDNMERGAVVTISLRNKATTSEPQPATEARISLTTEQMLMSMVSDRGMRILQLFKLEDIWGVSEISEQLQMPASSVYNELKKLEEAGMITKLGKKRVLTETGSRLLNV